MPPTRRRRRNKTLCRTTIATSPALAPFDDRPDAAILLGYLRRIEELRGYGAEDGIAVNAASEGDFGAFIRTMPSARKARLVLTDNSNLRAV